MTDALILLIDNIPDHAASYTQALRHDGFRVELADTAKAGLALARTLGPDCAVIDIRLPDMSGWELCREIKHSHETRRMPVVMLTPDTSREQVSESARARCNAWIAQPTIADDLVRAVRHVLAANTEAPASPEEAVLGATTCPACESDRVRATLRVSPVQYYSCRACGHGWRVEAI